ncbi:sulfite exporter TauE/SafE family protein [Georgenia thermotolerans]|uniref:Probable membrane transporter protein n=1 Tax=Georgenia thermotolerans TaxID=527326 RepID=A0A7J5UTK7_9MICO|nr:sulfite exporter TauE/SafE family protein [Georgenia thermotolerans]KAE8765617.1 TSUP family transporter [Georgenia thermotolerans]
MTDALLAAGIGVAVGAVVGVLGGGGGILTVPIFVYLLGTPPYEAATASLVIVGATSATALISHARAGNISWGHGAAFGVLGAAWSFLGSRLSAGVEPAALMATFSGLLAVVSVLMLRRARRRPSGASAGSDAAVDAPSMGSDPDPADRPGPARRLGPASPRSWHGVRRALTVIAAASVTGLLTGFLGVGGGFAVVPALVLALHLRMRVAVGTSLLVIALNSVTGLVGRAESLAGLDWATVTTFAVASMLGGVAGARISRRLQPGRLTVAFAVLLALVAVATAAQAVPDLISGRA